MKIRWPWSRDPDVERSLDAANEALSEVRRLKPQVKAATDAIAEHVMRNHFADAVAEIFRADR